MICDIKARLQEKSPSNFISTTRLNSDANDMLQMVSSIRDIQVLLGDPNPIPK